MLHRPTHNAQTHTQYGMLHRPTHSVACWTDHTQHGMLHRPHTAWHAAQTHTQYGMLHRPTNKAQTHTQCGMLHRPIHSMACCTNPHTAMVIWVQAIWCCKGDISAAVASEHNATLLTCVVVEKGSIDVQHAVIAQQLDGTALEAIVVGEVAVQD